MQLPNKFQFTHINDVGTKYENTLYSVEKSGEGTSGDATYKISWTKDDIGREAWTGEETMKMFIENDTYRIVEEEEKMKLPEKFKFKIKFFNDIVYSAEMIDDDTYEVTWVYLEEECSHKYNKWHVENAVEKGVWEVFAEPPKKSEGDTLEKIKQFCAATGSSIAITGKGYYEVWFKHLESEMIAESDEELLAIIDALELVAKNLGK